MLNYSLYFNSFWDYSFFRRVNHLLLENTTVELLVATNMVHEFLPISLRKSGNFIVNDQQS